MAKLTLQNITGSYASVAKLNANFTAIEEALENTLSRDGTTPNALEANIDANSNTFINLPDAVDITSPVTLKQMYAYLNALGEGTIALQRDAATATAGQTVFNLNLTYIPSTNNIFVFRNGSKLRISADYTETDNNTITLTAGASEGDEFEFFVNTTTTSEVTTASAVTIVDSGGYFTSNNVEDALQEVVEELAATSGSDLVGFVQGGTGASTTLTVQDKLREFVSVKDFGAVGDGVANDRTAIQNAFNASKKVFFPSGTYYLGTTAIQSEKLIDLSALGAGVTIETDGSVELVCETTADIYSFFFYLQNNSHFSCGPIQFRDTGSVIQSSPLRGAVAFYCSGAQDPGVGNWGNITIDAMSCVGLVAGMIVSGGNDAYRVRGIHIKQMFINNCYYGLNCQDQGDGVVIDNLVSYDSIRSYFVYGVTAHKVNIFNRNNKSTSGVVNISRYIRDGSLGGYTTSDIDVRYTAREQSGSNVTHVLINHLDLAPTGSNVIKDIRVHVDIESTTAYHPIRLVNYTGSGGSESNAASTNVVYDVELSGTCDANANPVSVYASYASKLNLTFNRGQNFFYDTTVPAAFYLDKASRDASVTWTASSVNPSIGNGTLKGHYDVVGGVCVYHIELTAGSTTAFGTGQWSFSAPFAATRNAIGSVHVFDSGATFYVGAARLLAGTSTIQCFNNAVASAYGATVPMTWAANDTLYLTISYPIS